MKKEKKTDFIATTIGSLIYSEHLNEKVLIRVNFYKTDKGNVCLVPVSGHNLNVIRPIPQVVISREEYDSAPYDSCDDLVLWDWATSKLGLGHDDWDEE